MTKKKSDHHDSVLFDEAISALSIKSNGIYIDATLGRGGHTQGILSSLKKSGKVIGFDQDIEAIKYAKKSIPDSRLSLIHSNFSSLHEQLDQLKLIDETIQIDIS